MNKFLTLLGKGVVLCLYWALVALFAWLFYDEYITEQSLHSIFLCIAFFSIGCGLQGLFIDWLGISYENGNVLGKVFMSWISIGIGICFIKMALGKN